MNKVLDVHSQRFLSERIRIRSRTQSAPAAILNDGTGAVPEDRVTTSLQSQQERGLPCAGSACDHYSRHAEVPSPVFATPNLVVGRSGNRSRMVGKLDAIRGDPGSAQIAHDKPGITLA